MVFFCFIWASALRFSLWIDINNIMNYDQFSNENYFYHEIMYDFLCTRLKWKLLSFDEAYGNIRHDK